mmetsp:Transcript_14838/g.25962  ORF Transcript_14838/g.25962 Transcript_14838/m.25962 type:complete len:665 (+) Transcript_14838:3299-5293(+)
MRRKRQKRSDNESSGEKHRAKLLFPGEEGGFIKEWVVSEKKKVDAGDVLAKCACRRLKTNQVLVRELIAPYDGTIIEILRKPEEEIGPVAGNESDENNLALVRMSYCLHDIVLPGMDLCGVCGRTPSQFSRATKADSAQPVGENTGGGIIVDASDSNAATMTLNVGDGNKIVVSRQEAETDRERTVKRLFKAKKLLLVLDIDHTLLHATDDQRAPDLARKKGVLSKLHQFKLGACEGHPASDKMHYIMLRPGLIEWLEQVSTMYELYIYTAGTRVYAEAVANIFDPSKRLFGSRIISRTDVPELGKIKRLERFFPIDNNMVLAIDDRSDVWVEDAKNLLTIRPYHFFYGMHEVNNSSGPDFETPEEQKEEVKALKSEKMDHGLRRAGELLKWVHEKFYEPQNLTVKDQLDCRGSDVKELVRTLRSRILRGLPVIVDMQSDYENKTLGDIVKACGGVLQEKIEKDTQVIISQTPSSKFANDGKLKCIWVLRPEWIHSCVHNWNKEPYEKYSLFRLSKSPTASDKSKKSENKTPSKDKAGPKVPQQVDDFGYPIEDDDEPAMPPPKSAIKVSDLSKSQKASIRTQKRPRVEKLKPSSKPVWQKVEEFDEFGYPIDQSVPKGPTTSSSKVPDPEEKENDDDDEEDDDDDEEDEDAVKKLMESLRTKT